MENLPKEHCCADLSCILSCIDNDVRVQYGTLDLEDPDGPLGTSHSVTIRIDANKCIMIMDKQMLGERVCQQCVLNFYIKSQFYDRIWKLTLKNRYYFQLTALMDIFGPTKNWLISKKILHSKKLFKKYYRYNCCRLISCKAGTPVFSYYVQRLNAVKGLFSLLMYLPNTKNLKWIVNNQTNMKYLHKMFKMFFDKSIEEVPPFDEEFVQTFTNLIHLIITIYFEKGDQEQQLKLSYETYMNTNKNQIMKKTWTKIFPKYQRYHKNLLVHCGNQKCTTKSYAKHKYGIGGTKYVKNKKKRNLCVTNKWYICKRCKCIHYCCRKCQKISWNQQNHKQFCIKN